jgi:hypothetical protein
MCVVTFHVSLPRLRLLAKFSEKLFILVSFYEDNIFSFFM